MPKFTKKAPDDDAKDVADEMNVLFARIARGDEQTLRDRMALGEMLVKQKEVVGHDHWMVWVAENLRFSIEIARECIRLHDHRDFINELLEDKTGLKPALTLTEALNLIAEKRKEERAKAKGTDTSTTTGKTGTTGTTAKTTAKKGKKVEWKKTLEFPNKLVEIRYTKGARNLREKVLPRDSKVSTSEAVVLAIEFAAAKDNEFLGFVQRKQAKKKVPANGKSAKPNSGGANDTRRSTPRGPTPGTGAKPTVARQQARAGSRAAATV